MPLCVYMHKQFHDIVVQHYYIAFCHHRRRRRRRLSLIRWIYMSRYMVRDENWDWNWEMTGQRWCEIVKIADKHVSRSGLHCIRMEASAMNLTATFKWKNEANTLNAHKQGKSNPSNQTCKILNTYFNPKCCKACVSWCRQPNHLLAQMTQKNWM